MFFYILFRGGIKLAEKKFYEKNKREKKKFDEKKKRIKFTGERFIPGIEDDALTVEHIQRYRSVLQLVKGKKVLDIACGEGYGTEILSAGAEEIIGIDIDTGSVQRAKNKYQKQNLTYLVGDITAIPVSDHSIDIVVSFETIEHVEEIQQQQFLIEIKRVLKPEGILIISTPNKAIYSDRHQYQNKWHKKEFYKEEFQKFLQKEFQYLTFYHQYDEVLNVIEQEEVSKEAAFFRGREREGKYYIVIASNQSPLPVIQPVLTMRSEEEYERCLVRIQCLQQEEEERNLHIQKLDQEIENKDSRIVELQESEINRNVHIDKLDQEIAEKNQVIQENRKQLEILELKLQYAEQEKLQVRELLEVYQRGEEQYNELRREFDSFKEQRIQELKAVEMEKNQIIDDLKLEIEKKNRQIQELEEKKKEEIQKIEDIYKEQVKEYKKLEKVYQEICIINKQLKKTNDEISMKNKDYQEKIKNFDLEQDKLQTSLQKQEQIKKEMEQQIRNREGHIELLLESDRELERIKHSRSWRLLSIIWKTNSKVFPIGSKRRLCGKLVLKAVRHPVQSIKMAATPRKLKNFFYYLKKDGAAFVSQRVDESFIGVKVIPETLVLEQVEKEVQKDIWQYKPLNFTWWKEPEVSIVIPVYNQFEYTYNCLKSILSNSGEITYEVIIANDNSTDITTQITEIVKNIKVITNQENLRFLKNCNHAAKAARGKYIFFLNNDTQVQPNWLQPLVDLMEHDLKIGLVGSKLVYADGRLQEAGGILWKDGSAWNYGNRSNPEDPEYNYVKEVDYISGAAILIRKTLWEEIGGFDERFAPAYYEDTDLAFEVRKKGFKVVYQPKSVVVHFEGISNGVDISSGQKAYQKINEKKFYDKWNDILEKEHFENGTEVFKAKDRSKNKKHILVIDHYVPMYDKDAGNKCSFMYISLFVQLGFQVTFIGDNFFKHEPYTTELNQMGVEVLYGNYYYENWKNWLKENLYNFDYVYMQRPHISIKYIDLVKKYSNAKVIYFGHDLHYLREMRQYEIEKDSALLKSAEKWKKIEFELFQKVDIVYVVGFYEQAILQKEFPQKPIRNIPLYIYEEIKEKKKIDFRSKQNMIFVGGFGHPPNIDAVLWFAKIVFPDIVKYYPDIKWYIVGSNPTEEIKKLNSKNIVIKGFVSDKELKQLYNECRLAVVPLRVGAGVKGKVVEAVYNRIPLVTTPIGAEGLSLKEDAFIVTECNEEMSKIINSVYSDYDRLQQLSDHCITFIQNYFTQKVAKEVVLQDLK